jgi:predicted dehydrogenase
MMKSLNRREFVKQSMGAATALAALPHTNAAGANERIVVGVMGIGGRGTGLARMFAGRNDVEIAYLCDADTRRFARAQAAVEQTQDRPVQCVQDFRRILDDPAVDVLINATPDHWHGLGTILACQAGKHVYVEKPMAHNLWEGRKMVEAARQYNRVVTVGMQSRSASYVQTAREIVRSGKLGDIRLVRVYNMMQHPFREPGPETPVPTELDYNLWSGPARLLPYHPRRYWLNFAEYSCGPIPGDAVHQLDLARFLLGDPPPPQSVVHQGGIQVLRDGRDTPDSQYATYEYDDFTFLFQGTLWTPYMKKIPQETRNTDRFPDWPFCSTKIEILGTKDFMQVGRHGGGWQVLDGNNQVIAESYGRQGDADHIENFLQCVRSGNRPNADVEQGHQSVLLCHLANIAWQAGNPRLIFDAETETFRDSPEANRLLKRPAYRAPWVVPEPV